MPSSETEKYLRKRNIRVRLSHLLLAERAAARGIEVFPDAQRRLTFKVGQRYVWFDGALTNINQLLARRCVRYKDITSRLLQNAGIPTASNVVFTPDQLEAAWAWAQPQAPVVVKPPNEGMGDSVHVKISSYEHFHWAFTAVAQSAGSVLVERFIPGVEHRVMLVYGKVVAAAKRIPAHVIGDGRSTVSELIDAKNRLRSQVQNPVHYEIPVDDVVLQHLDQHDMSLDSIAESGTQVWLRPNSNVHSGGDGVDATDQLRPEEIAVAERTAEAIPGLRLAGIDMLLPREGQGTGPHILEINGSPQISGHHFPWYGQSRDVAGALLDAMYNWPPRRSEPPQRPRPRAARLLRNRLRPLRPLVRRHR